MATKIKEAVEVSPLKRVSSLRRNNLLYNGDTWRIPKSIGGIACTHGTDIRSIVRLARDGHFSGAFPELQGEFYTIPNHQFVDLDKSSLRPEIIEAILNHKVDAIEKAIEYAEGDSATTAIAEESQSSDHHGVVIAFKGNALSADSKFWLNEDDGSPELIFPHAPSLETIQGIYPVDLEAARNLKQELARLAIQQ